MTSDTNYREAYVWLWLPGETKPVVAGRLEEERGVVRFNYGRSYLRRENPPAIPIYSPELPLEPGPILPPKGMQLAGCIRDASPDAWGRRVVINKLHGRKGPETDTADLGELTYLLASGSDRIGALDFQESPTDYVPRSQVNATLEEIQESVERVEQGIPLTPELDQALFHGSSIGGARPKALVEGDGRKFVAKFSSSTDLFSVVKAEFVAMRLASHVGIDVAPVTLVSAAHKDVLLIERFDRTKTENGWQRRLMVSALTLFGLDDMMARYASYEDFAEIIRQRFDDPKNTLEELFKRLVFNILCGNTDDHARNHAAFWDGQSLSLTPAYDICPQGRTGNEASQAMLIQGSNNLSQLKTCIQAAPQFLLTRKEALDICSALQSVIEKRWTEVCDEAELSTVDRNLLWGRQFLNPFALES